MDYHARLPNLVACAPIAPAKVEAMVFRAPIEQPVITSFGIMRDRPSVVVRVEDKEGAVGWGESCGAIFRPSAPSTGRASSKL
jgi:L-alanine-DL-glutamate epimerase-like enolase superfamily enzyme